MRRREVITLLGGAAVAWPLAGRAQQPATLVIGFLRSTAVAGSEHLVKAFRQGLSEAGFIEGQNIAIEYRWGDDQFDRLPALAADLVRRQVAAIVGNATTARVAKAATTTIPIVFVAGLDPVKTGLVASLNRPGGNVTGVVFDTVELTAKRLGLLNELLPKVAVVGVLLDSSFLEFKSELKDVEEAGRSAGRQMLVLKASNEHEINEAFASIAQAKAGAILVGAGPVFLGKRREIIALATRYKLPASYVTRQYPEAGGLMSYGPSQTDAYRRAGLYVAKILNGVKPADLPVELPTKFELVVNIKTAKALGVDVPAQLLARADEVIE
jgi:putative tryptophan/tyrosine transport system substrate-binding protein